MHRLIPSIDSKTSPAPPNANESLDIAIKTYRSDPTNDVAKEELVNILEDVSKQLAKSRSLRESIGVTPILWDDLTYLWNHIGSQELDNDLAPLVNALGKFLRNVVAEIPANQQRAFQLEPLIRKIIHQSTSMAMIHSPQMNTVARILTQGLSNIITANEELAAQLWNTYMNLTDEGSILIRLAAVDDINTLSTVLVFILNCLDNSEARCIALCETPAGRRTCIGLLDHIAVLIECPDNSPEAKACDIAYQIFKQLFTFGLALKLYTALQMSDRPITPHQQTLLKLLDGYYQSNPSALHLKYSDELPTLLMELSSFAITAMRTAISAKDVNPDRYLPPVCEALVLVTQCIHATLVRHPESLQSLKMRSSMKQTTTKDGGGSIETCIELLRQFDLFLPKIVFGKPVQSSLAGSQTPHEDGSDSKGFAYVKRDVIKVIGALAHQDKEVQDRVRECGGLEVVLNHCVMDERNPYLREHAIFAVRNLLKDNHQNQTNVSELKPLKDFDVNGILRPV